MNLNCPLILLIYLLATKRTKMILEETIPQKSPTKMMEGFLNNLLKFNNSLSAPLFLAYNSKQYRRGILYVCKSLRYCIFKTLFAETYLLPLFKLDMSIDIVLYKWHKINIFIIGFSAVLYFIYPFFFASILEARIKSLFNHLINILCYHNMILLHL